MRINTNYICQFFGFYSMIKVEIIEKRAIIAKILRQVLSKDPNIRITGSHSNINTGLVAVEENVPDLVILDYEISGDYTADIIEKIKQFSPDCEVVLNSEHHNTKSNTSVKALELGAIYFIRKYSRQDYQEAIEYYAKYLNPIINLYNIRQQDQSIREKSSQDTEPQDNSKIIHHGKYDLMVVGSSLGGPEALARLIPQLPKDFPVPILLVQHMPEKFTTSLSAKLDSDSEIRVKEAVQAEMIQPGNIYIAPGGYHLLLKRMVNSNNKYMTHLNQRDPVNGCRPSIDVLFESVAKTFEGNVLAVILTGMGSDGTDGVTALKEATGCFCITQSAESCAVYGMPQSVDEAGLSDLSVPLDKLAETLIKLTRKRNPILTV